MQDENQLRIVAARGALYAPAFVDTIPSLRVLTSGRSREISFPKVVEFPLPESGHICCLPPLLYRFSLGLEAIYSRTSVPRRRNASFHVYDRMRVPWSHW